MKTIQPKVFILFGLILSLQLVDVKSFAQTPSLTILAKLPLKLDESSGLILTSSGNLWTVIDSKEPILYNIDLDGKIKRTIRLPKKNQDWEEIAQDDSGNVYIGNFGNNGNRRKNLSIYKISPPDLIEDTITNPEVIKFHYPDQKLFPPSATNMMYDMEAMICFDSSIYLFSKNRTKPFTGYTKMYKLPNTPGDYEAELMDSVYIGPEPMVQNWVTAADLSSDHKILALLSSDKVTLFYCFKDDQFFKGKMKTILLNNFSQKEGICFINNTEFYITDELFHEFLGGNLYKLKIDKDYSKECK